MSIPEHLKGRIPNHRWQKCPWCGADWKHFQMAETPDGGEAVAVMCVGCGVSGPEADTPQNAVRLWNKGPTARRNNGEKMSDEIKRLALDRLMKQRIDELVAENDALRRERDALQEENARLGAAMHNDARLVAESREDAKTQRARADRMEDDMHRAERERDALKKVVEAAGDMRDLITTRDPNFVSGLELRLCDAVNAYYAEYGGKDEPV